jgi:hypothetical protein
VTITGTGDLASAPSSPFGFTISASESGDWLFAVSNFPLGTVPSFYTTVAGRSAPAVLGEVTLNSQASLTIATYSSGSAAEGLTVVAQATATGSLSKAAATLGATSTRSYKLSLYVPLFGAQSPSTISLSESGALPLASHVQLNSYSISVVLSSVRDQSLLMLLALILQQAHRILFQRTAVALCHHCW